MSSITVENLIYRYPNTKSNALDNISFKISEGEFVLLLGDSGCGKSTLLRAVSRLIPDFHGGSIQGIIRFDDIDIRSMKPSYLSSIVGCIFQNPENQIVFNEVTKEIVFGMENLAFKYDKMRLNLADVSTYLGINHLLKKKTGELSGGEKQKVAIASVLSMEPRILLLDEPTSQLDPISAESIINTIRRLNEDFGITVIMVEHRLDKCFHLADRIIFMKNGHITYNNDPSRFMIGNKENITPYMPVVSRIFKKSGIEYTPYTVREAKSYLKKNYTFTKTHPDNFQKTKDEVSNKETIIRFEDVFFSYAKNDNSISDGNTERYYAIKDINLTIHKGDLLSLHGGVGAGKSTLMKIATMEYRPISGRLWIRGTNSESMSIKDIAGRFAYLSQNPGDYISQDTVQKEMELSLYHYKGEDKEQRIKSILNRFNLFKYINNHPRDLSTGERQRLAIASLLLLEPELMILDEPTRGLDYNAKSYLGETLINLNKDKMTIIIITHDIGFAHDYCRRSAIMSQGEIITVGNTDRVLNQSYSYVTEAGKLFRGIDPSITSEQEAIDFLNKKQ